MIDISKIDFSDTTAVRDSATRLFIEANDMRLFINENRPTPQHVAMRRIAGQWVTRAADAISRMTPADARSVTDLYGLIHRIAYGIPPSQPIQDSRTDTSHKINIYEAI